MRTTNSHGKKFTYLLGAAVAGLLVALVVMADLGPPGVDTNFEIDVPANALDEEGEGYDGDDWETVYKCFQGGGYDVDDCNDLGGLNDKLINTTGILYDDNQETIFWKGGSKDIRDVSQWAWKHGSVPDKDEISHAGAAAYAAGTGGDELVMYIFADRFSNDGDAQMGAWFFQDVVDTVENPATSTVTSSGWGTSPVVVWWVPWRCGSGTNRVSQVMCRVRTYRKVIFVCSIQGLEVVVRATLPPSRRTRKRSQRGYPLGPTRPSRVNPVIFPTTALWKAVSISQVCSGLPRASPATWLRRAAPLLSTPSLRTSCLAGSIPARSR